MIHASDLLSALVERGRTFWSGVPCSLLGGLLESLGARDDVLMLHAANEGDAVAACAGASLGGRGAVAFLQNSGLGNAVSPLASLTWPFRIPMLLLVTLRGDPEGEDEPQHRLMGSATLPVLRALGVPSVHLPRSERELAPLLDHAESWMRRASLPFALIVRPATFPAWSPPKEAPPLTPRRVGTIDHLPRGDPGAELPDRATALERVVSRTRSARCVVIGSTGYISRELFGIEDAPNHLYMVGSMGCASSLGLGLSCARPELDVIVVEGDGAALMRMGNLAMVGAQAGPNLTHVVLDNAMHESTGRQPTLSSAISLAEVAHACGYAEVVSGQDVDLLERLLAPPRAWGARMLHLEIRPGTRASLPRPTCSPEQVSRRLSAHLETLRVSTDRPQEQTCSRWFC